MRWSAMTEEARDRALQRLLKDNGARGGPAQRTVTSTAEQLAVTGSPRIAPGLEKGFEKPSNALVGRM